MTKADKVDGFRSKMLPWISEPMDKKFNILVWKGIKKIEVKEVQVEFIDVDQLIKISIDEFVKRWDKLSTKISNSF